MRFVWVYDIREDLVASVLGLGLLIGGLEVTIIFGLWFLTHQ